MGLHALCNAIKVSTSVNTITKLLNDSFYFLPRPDTEAYELARLLTRIAKMHQGEPKQSSIFKYSFSHYKWHNQLLQEWFWHAGPRIKEFSANDVVCILWSSATLKISPNSLTTPLLFNLVTTLVTPREKHALINECSAEELYLIIKSLNALNINPGPYFMQAWFDQVLNTEEKGIPTLEVILQRPDRLALMFQFFTKTVQNDPQIKSLFYNNPIITKGLDFCVKSQADPNGQNIKSWFDFMFATQLPLSLLDYEKIQASFNYLDTFCWVLEMINEKEYSISYQFKRLKEVFTMAYEGHSQEVFHTK